MLQFASQDVDSHKCCFQSLTLTTAQVGAALCASTVVFSMLPCLYHLWLQPRQADLLRACAYAALCGFMFGFHVHEKAALTVVLLLAFHANSSEQTAWCAARPWFVSAAATQPCCCTCVMCTCKGFQYLNHAKFRARHSCYYSHAVVS